jgi:hypothetical protein
MEGPVFTRLEQSDALFDFGLAFRSAFGYQRTVRTETNGISFRSWNAGSRAALAQLVEHIIRNDGVACSSHASGTSKIKHLALVLNTSYNLVSPKCPHERTCLVTLQIIGDAWG